MPIIKSAKKRVRVASKASVRNSKTKRNLKSAIKTFSSSHKAEDARKAQSALDIAVKKGVMHKNKAARKKKQLAAQAKAAGSKVTKVAKKTVKAAPKAAAKKAPVKKKIIAKKAAAKKTTPKK